MLHLRVSADVKCPRHPRRTYEIRPAGCGMCQAISDSAELARRAEQELRAAARLGAELRWKNFRRAQPASSSSKSQLEASRGVHER